MSEPSSPSATLSKTPLHALHLELGAKMVPFAGYDMPVSYPAGILAEHRQCRESAVLFDVSHMGQLRLVGSDAAAALETLVPVDVVGLAEGRQRYALFTNDDGGILDDLMVTRRADHLFLVVNASCKDADTEHLRSRIGQRCDDRADARSRPARAAGTEGRRRDGATRTRAREARLHERRRGADRRHRRLRDALGLHRRGRLRDLGRCYRRRGARSRPPRRAGGHAGRPRRARHLAAGSRPVPLRPRHRHDDHAGRSRPDLGDPEGASARRRARRRLSGCGDDRRAARRRRRAQARRPRRPRPRAGARRRGARRRRRRRRRPRHERHDRTDGRQARRARLRQRPNWPRSECRCSPTCAASCMPMQVTALPFVPHRYFRG